MKNAFSHLILFSLLVMGLVACEEAPLESDIAFDKIEDEYLRGCLEAWTFEFGIIYKDDLFAIVCENASIRTIAGLEQFKELRTLILPGNALREIDITPFPELQYLDLAKNNFLSLNLSSSPQLLEVTLSENTALSELNIQGNKELVKLLVDETDLDSIDLSQNTKLEVLNAKDTQLEGDLTTGALDLSNNSALEVLVLEDNEITHIDLSQNNKLFELDLDRNDLVEIELKNHSNLTRLYLNQNQLTSLDASFLTGLDTLEARENQINEIWLPLTNELRFLELADNQISCDSGTCNGLSVFQIPQNNSSPFAFVRLNLQNNLLETSDIDLSQNLFFTELILSGNAGITGEFMLTSTNLIEVRLNDTGVTSINFGTAVNYQQVFARYPDLQELTAVGAPLNAATNQIISDMNENECSHPTYDALILCYASLPSHECKSYLEEGEEHPCD